MIIILNHLSAPASVICLYLSLIPVGKLTTETTGELGFLFSFRSSSVTLVGLL